MTGTLHKSVSYGRKTIAFGLPWFTADEEEQPRKAANSLVRQAAAPYDLMVVRRGELPQFALACTSDGARSGSLAGAAIVAEMAGPESWLFVMEIGDGIWICAGREGYVLADGDVLYDNHDTAQEAFRALNPANFKKVSIPRSWHEHRQSALEGAAEGIEETDIRDFLSCDVPKWAKLQSISSAGALLKATAAFLVLAAVGFVGLRLLSPEPAAIDDPDAARRALAEIERRRQARIETAYERLDSKRPWQSAPRARAALDTCLAALGGMPVAPVGYEVKTLTCADGRVEAEAKRTAGYSRWLQEWARGYDGVSVDLATNGATGTISRDYDMPPMRGDQRLDSAETFDLVAGAIFERAQIEGAGVTITPPSVETYPDYPDYVPRYATATFEITTKRPRVWLDSFSEFTGFAVTSVSHGLEDRNFTMEGKIYVPNL